MATTAWLLYALLALALLHAALLALAVLSIAFTNPFRRFREYEPGWRGRRGAKVLAVDGHTGPIQVDWIATGPPRPVVLLCHGRSRRASWMLPMADHLAADFDVCLFDHRHHGDRGFGTSSLGHRESHEVEAVLARLEREGYDRIGVVGISIGAASALAAAARRPSAVRAVVSIGCFDDLASFLRQRSRSLLVPPYLYPAVRRAVERLADYSIGEVRPAEAAQSLGAPLLVLHGRKDRLVPPEAAGRLAAAAGVEPRFYDGGHDEPGHPEVLDSVRRFLAEHLLGRC